MNNLFDIVIRFGGIGVILVIIQIIIKIRPITLLTAQDIEMKLFSKEAQFSIKIIKFLGEMISSSLALYILMVVFNEWKLPVIDFLILLYFIVIALTLSWTMYYSEIKGKTPKFIRNHRFISSLIYLFFLTILFSFPAYYLGPSSIELATNLTVKEQFLVFAFLCLIIALPLLYISKITFKVFDIEGSRGIPIYVEIEGERWYIQHRMNSNYIYLSDHQEINKSRKFRFFEWRKISDFILLRDQWIFDHLEKNIKKSYNNHATERDHNNIEPWKVQEREQFLTRAQNEGFKTILEIGAGPGRDSLYFHENGLQVTTIDFSEEMVRLCKAKGLPDVHQMDLRELTFESNRFDAVYALNCLLHIPKAEIPAVLQKIRRVLKPNGLFFYGVYGGQDSEGIWEQDTYEPKRFFSFYKDEDIKQMVQQYFILEDFHTVDMGENKPHFQSITLRKPLD